MILYLEILYYVPRDLAILYPDIVDSIHNVRILVSVITKSKYSILKYICSLSLGYLRQHCCMGITLLTKEITPKYIFCRNEIHIGMLCLQKGR